MKFSMSRLSVWSAKAGPCGNRSKTPLTDPKVRVRIVREADDGRRLEARSHRGNPVFAARFEAEEP